MRGFFETPTIAALARTIEEILIGQSKRERRGGTDVRAAPHDWRMESHETIENGIKARRSELSAEKQALLERRLARAHPTDRRDQPFCASRTGMITLLRATAASGSWTSWNRNSPLYNLPMAVRLHGPAQCRSLAQAINTIVERHEGCAALVSRGAVRCRYWRVCAGNPGH